MPRLNRLPHLIEKFRFWRSCRRIQQGVMFDSTSVQGIYLGAFHVVSSCGGRRSKVQVQRDGTPASLPLNISKAASEPTTHPRYGRLLLQSSSRDQFGSSDRLKRFERNWMSKALNGGKDSNTNETSSIEPGYQLPDPARTTNPLPRLSTPGGIGANSRREVPGLQRTCRFDRPDRHWLSYLSACCSREKSTS
jgi:hypothetical protein